MEKQKVHKKPAKAKGDSDDEDGDAKEQTAYEDSWYRSLKAISERKPVEPDEDVADPED